MVSRISIDKENYQAEIGFCQKGHFPEGSQRVALKRSAQSWRKPKKKNSSQIKPETKTSGGLPIGEKGP